MHADLVYMYEYMSEYLVVCLQVLYRESLVIEDWELDERDGGERTAHEYEHFRWEQSASRRSLLAYLEASRSGKSDAQVCAPLTLVYSCIRVILFLVCLRARVYYKYCVYQICLLVYNTAVPPSSHSFRRQRALLVLRARTPLVRQLLQRISARRAPRKSTGPQSKACTVRSERRHARLATPPSTPERWAAARCSLLFVITTYCTVFLC